MKNTCMKLSGRLVYGSVLGSKKYKVINKRSATRLNFLFAVDQRRDLKLCVERCLLSIPQQLAVLVKFFKSNYRSSSKANVSLGRREGEEEGVVCPRASESRGPHQLISKLSFIASLDVFKEPPNRSSLQCSKSAPRFPCFLPLLLALITDKGPHFAVLPLGLENP